MKVGVKGTASANRLTAKAQGEGGWRERSDEEKATAEDRRRRYNAERGERRER